MGENIDPVCVCGSELSQHSGYDNQERARAQALRAERDLDESEGCPICHKTPCVDNETYPFMPLPSREIDYTTMTQRAQLDALRRMERKA